MKRSFIESSDYLSDEPSDKQRSSKCSKEDNIYRSIFDASALDDPSSNKNDLFLNDESDEDIDVSQLLGLPKEREIITLNPSKNPASNNPASLGRVRDVIRIVSISRAIELIELGEKREDGSAINSEDSESRSIWLSRCCTEHERHIICSILDKNDLAPALKDIPNFTRLLLGHTQVASRDDVYLRPLFDLIAAVLRRHSASECEQTTSSKMTPVCPNCGSMDVELESSTMDHICCQCGSVVQSGIWDNADIADSGVVANVHTPGRNFIKDGVHVREYSSTDRGRRRLARECHLKILRLCRTVGMESEADNVETLLRRYFFPRAIRTSSSLFDKVVIACCFILLRQNGDVITISALATRSGIHSSSLKSIVYRVLTVLGIRDLPIITPESFINMSTQKIISRFKQRSERDEDELVDGSEVVVETQPTRLQLTMEDVQNTDHSNSDYFNCDGRELDRFTESGDRPVEMGEKSSDFLDVLFDDTNTPTEGRIDDFLEDQTENAKNGFRDPGDNLLLDSIRISSNKSILPFKSPALQTPVLQTSASLESPTSSHCPSSLLIFQRMLESPKVLSRISNEKLANVSLLSQQLVEIFIRARNYKNKSSSNGSKASLSSTSSDKTSVDRIVSTRMMEQRLTALGVESGSGDLVMLNAAAIFFSGAFLRTPIGEKEIAKALDLNLGSFWKVKYNCIANLRWLLTELGILDERLNPNRKQKKGDGAAVKLVVQLVQSNYDLLLEMTDEFS